METSLFTDLRQISDKLGFPFTLRPHQTMIRYSISDETIMVALTVHRYKESIRETKLTHRGTTMITFTASKITPGHWIREEMTVWDEDFTPYALHQVGRIETPAEYRDRREWEAMQYRVGSASNPMDNAERSSDPTYSPMHDYWMQG